MVMIAVKHDVKDYESWEKVYKSYTEVRRAHGGKEGSLLSPAGGTGPVLIIEEWTSPEAFQAFVEDIDLPTVMKGAGVTSAPDITIFEAKVDHE